MIDYGDIILCKSLSYSKTLILFLNFTVKSNIPFNDLRFKTIVLLCFQSACLAWFSEDNIITNLFVMDFSGSQFFNFI